MQGVRESLLQCSFGLNSRDFTHANQALALGQGCGDGHNKKDASGRAKGFSCAVQLGCFCFSSALKDSGRTPGLPGPTLSFLSTAEFPWHVELC